MVWYSSCRIMFMGLIIMLISSWVLDRCEGIGEFGFEFHHRFSDQVVGVLPGDGLPNRDSSKYYRVMAHRDRLIRGRRLASAEDQSLVTFADGNETTRVDALGFLHYANVTIGTPSDWFLVALDTGSDLFWLPCDCANCVRELKAPSGSSVDLNIYSPNASSTSNKVPCNSSLCTRGDRCASPSSNCPYQIKYLSNGTSSTGVLVEDVLHLVSNEKNSKSIRARVTLGCGQVQTGVFHDGAAPNGLFGLGLEDISVPSILAKEGIAANSFSMCFGNDGAGRISFGDKGSVDQRETPLNIRQPHPTYNITVTQISVGGNTGDLEFDAVFDSGTSFTYLTDAAYTLISKSFNSLALDKRYQTDSELPFEYCYALSPSKDSFQYPAVNLTMKGGSSYPVYHPLVVIPMKDTDVYCLAIMKIEEISIIGQNFMTGYRVVFDREKLVLGWKESDCYTGETSARTLPSNRSSSSARPPASSFEPEATNIPSQRPTTSTSSSSYSLSIISLSFFYFFSILAFL
uniref:Aspartic proteinase-like protein 1 n=1 Tax=Noccaea caerulescens TaxID=107243 RepID=A0A1J3EUZ3_NOCCA